MHIQNVRWKPSHYIRIWGGGGIYLYLSRRLYIYTCSLLAPFGVDPLLGDPETCCSWWQSWTACGYLLSGGRHPPWPCRGQIKGPHTKREISICIYIYVTAPELFKFVLAIGRMGTVDMTITRSQLFDDGESISVNNVRNRTSVVMVMTKP